MAFDVSATATPSQSGAALDAAVDRLVAGRFVVVDRHGRVSDWTAAAQEAFGRPAKLAVGRLATHALDLAGVPAVGDDDALEAIVAAGEGVAELRGGPDGSVAVSVLPVHLRDGDRFSRLLNALADPGGAHEDELRDRCRQVLGGGDPDAAPVALGDDEEPVDELPDRIVGALLLFAVDGGDGGGDGGDGGGSGGSEPAVEAVEARALDAPALPDVDPAAPAAGPEAEAFPPVRTGRAADAAPAATTTPAPPAPAAGTASRDVPAPAGPSPVTRATVERALAEDGFVLHCQPVLDLATDAIAQYELLIRLPGPRGRVLAPSAFLPVAGEAGLLPAVDRWVVRRAIELAARRREAGDEVRLAVNLSADSLREPGITTVIEEELAITEVDPRSLVLEVTEAAAVTHLEQTQRLARWLRGMGCSLALDDFGSTYGALRCLRQLPVDFLKLDGDLVVSLTESRTNRLVLDAVVGIAAGIGSRTVAEWVSDEETLGLVREHGVDFAQGFLVGRPRAMTEIWPEEG